MTVLLQSVTVVTKRVGFIPKRDSYHKMQRLLQDASVSTFNIILHSYCIKCVRIWSFLVTPYLSVFSPNVGKDGPEKLRLRIVFTK